MLRMLLAAALGLAAYASPAQSRPYTVDDLLSAEEFGQVGFSPDGRWLIFEQLRGHANSGPFDDDVYTGSRRGRIHVLDLKQGGPPRLLLAADEDEGHAAGPVSPDSRRLAVLRRKGRSWEVGVTELQSGETRWLGVTPELGRLGETLVWRGSHELIIAARPKADAPLLLRTGWQGRQERTRLWADSARGRSASLKVIGSGRFLDVRPRGFPGALLLVDLKTGATRELAQGDAYDLELSPDGRRLAAMIRLEDRQSPTEIKLQVASATRRRNLVLVDLQSGVTTLPCPTCHLSTHLIAWSNNSKEVLVHGQATGDPLEEPKLLRLSPTGVVRSLETVGYELVVDRTNEGYEIPRALWLGGTPAALMRPKAGGRADWILLTDDRVRNLTAGLASPETVLAQSGGALFLAAEGQAWRIGKTDALRAVHAASGPAAKAGLGLSNRLKVAPGHELAFEIAPPPGAARAWRAPDGSTRLYPHYPGRIAAAAVGRSAVAVVRRVPDGALVLDLVQPDGVRTVATLNPEFRAIDFADVREIRTQGPDGESLSHWLHLPPVPRGGGRPPLVAAVYPGAIYAAPHEPYGRGIGRFSVNAELLTAAGYAVLVPSLPRKIGEEPGAGLAAQILDAVDLAAQTAEVDADRLILMGQSFGGYGALMAGAQSSRFAAIIASAAPTDLGGVYGAIDPHHAVRPEDGLELNANYGWAETNQGSLGLAPWVAPDLYARNSPFYLADQIQAPVLLIHADDDFIRLSQAQAMFSALYRQGKDAQLITAFGEGHIIQSPANRREVWRLTLAWLNQVLGDS